MAGQRVLRLEAREFLDLTRWRWVLTDSRGSLVADHEVRLDASRWEYEAFGDLPGYLRWHCAPDRWAEDEARIVGEVGAWIGSWALGPSIGAPVTVRVVVPPEAAELLYRPLELAHANGRPLAVQDVTLVMAPDGVAADIEPVGDRLRVLGLFSLPEGGRALNLRRERTEMVRLVRAIAANGKAADVRVLQYGVTRDRLREVLEETEGWDIIHVSGHGRPGSLTLETASGAPDRVTARELAGLLDAAREHLKLVTVSACWSAAVLAAQERRLFDLPVPDQDRQGDSAEPDRGDGSSSSGALATEIAQRLGCAVLAMRYPVDDDFAIALSGKLYDLLADKGQPLPRAVGMTMRKLSAAAGGGASAGGGPFPALSVGTPAIFGGVAADLRLAAPSRAGQPSYDTVSLKMAGFPPEPARFVGRTGALARASAALAIASGVPGVLLHGMPGGGKTACALELAYGHEESFDRLVWYKAPDEGMAIDGALTDFALTLERYLDGFQMADSLVPADALAAFLPRLRELTQQRRLLIVIDNAESLLSQDGAWRDGRWGSVIGALTGHAGLGRVILTSRRILANGMPGMRVEPVDALSADEALLLARELPNLSALKLGNVPGIGAVVSKQLARGAIAMAQGHPKLLELAEGQAANPGHLLRLVKAGDQAWRKLGRVPDGFFASGEPTAVGKDYLHVLAAWTKAVTDTLAPGERDLFWFLCCLAEPDRERNVLDNNWHYLWEDLGRPGQPPDLEHALDRLIAAGLIASRPAADPDDESYPVHPGIAAAGRSHAGRRLRDTADAQLAWFWDGVFGAAGGQSDAGVDTALMFRAATSAVPYMLRQEQWDRATALIEGSLVIDSSRANAARLLPTAQMTARHDPAQAPVLAAVLQDVDPAAAAALTGEVMDTAVARGDFKTAAAAAARLALLCVQTGRLPEALTLAEQNASYIERSGLGPWTQLSGEILRLQVAVRMGQAVQALEEARQLREHAQAPVYPIHPSDDEAVAPWEVWEGLLSTGRDAAITAQRWQDAVTFGTDLAACMRARNVPAVVSASFRLGDYLPLLRLGRLNEALELSLACHDVAVDVGDVGLLAESMNALAEIEDARGNGDAAVRLQRDSLRYGYISAREVNLADNVVNIAVGHHNLGNYLAGRARQPAQALASHLASALIEVLAGGGGESSGRASGSVRAAATDLRESGGATVPPRDIADLYSRLADIPGTDLPGLIARLSPDPESAEQALRDLITQARELADGTVSAVSRHTGRNITKS
jgi:hypothetical protein